MQFESRFFYRNLPHLAPFNFAAARMAFKSKPALGGALEPLLRWAAAGDGRALREGWRLWAAGKNAKNKRCVRRRKKSN